MDSTVMDFMAETPLSTVRPGHTIRPIAWVSLIPTGRFRADSRDLAVTILLIHSMEVGMRSRVAAIL
jgi:hypothetical protein